MSRDVFILGGKRTAMGEYVGALKDVSAIELGATASRGALAATGVRPDEIEPAWLPAENGARMRLALHAESLAQAGLELAEFDLIEVNEAFAAQYLAVEKELGLDRDRTNVNGGAIALGHPLGATGTRLVLTLLNELGRRGGRYGLATACIGGGQGIAMICERL